MFRSGSYYKKKKKKNECIYKIIKYLNWIKYDEEFISK